MQRTIIRTIFAAALGTALAAGTLSAAQAQIASIDSPVVLGQPLTLTLGAPPSGTDCPTQAAALNAQGLVLVANGQTIPGARASFGCSAKGELVGTASTSIAGNGDDAAQRRAAWQTAFSGFFSLSGTKTLPIAFGPATGGMSTAPKLVAIQGASDRDLGLAGLWFALVAAGFLFAFFRHFGRMDSITPISGVPMPADYRAPYSLARFQLLWWSGIVTASYVAILTITGSMDTVTTGTMALMGIVGGTSVLAAFQDRRPGDDGRQPGRGLSPDAGMVGRPAERCRRLQHPPPATAGLDHGAGHHLPLRGHPHAGHAGAVGQPAGPDRHQQRHLFRLQDAGAAGGDADRTGSGGGVRRARFRGTQPAQPFFRVAVEGYGAL
ncbi:hypothetical protein [Azospirillum sp. INR13]|uniref:hypothetical protein n=1 Tax=Azospirillum sp. INR13 TaxID=2596919 RepID=UPI002108373E|nr:hypothetical protein [Azospirillum sp. INR13]